MGMFANAPTRLRDATMSPALNGVSPSVVTSSASSTGKAWPNQCTTA